MNISSDSIKTLTAGLVFSLGAFNAAACTAPPPAAIDIDANSYYIDKNHSVIDPVLKARNVAHVKPIEDFLAHVAESASRYQADPTGNIDDAKCTLNWLSTWAGQRAMLGKLTTEQSYYTRKWTLAGLALSYAKLQSIADATQRKNIETWFMTLADATIAHSEQHKGARNNHYYWEGLAVTAVGGITKEARYLDWGRKVLDNAMSEVAADGSLPREMERAVKALHYHAFALAPLVMMASILDVHSPKLDRLFLFTVNGAKNASNIEKATGFAQEMPSNAAMSWKIIYARHENKPEFKPTPASPWPRLGGELNLPNPLEHVAQKVQ